MKLLRCRRRSRRRIGVVAAAVGCGLSGLLTAMLAWAAPPAGGGGAAARPGPGSAAGAAGTRDVIENYPDGKLHVRYQTDAAGMKTGQYLELFPNGRPRVRGAYLADKKQGLWTTLDQAGKTLESAGYSKGVLEGPYQWMAEDGTAAMKTAYHLGEYTAPVTVLGERGRLLFAARYPRPLTEIHRAWAALYPTKFDPVKYTKEPNLSPPYAAGTLTPECMEEGLRLTRLYRYLSGVPWQNLTLDATDSDKAQHAAVLLTRTKKLSHTPDKPPDMDDAFFKIAYAGCHESNLFEGRPDLVSAVRWYMDDSDEPNIAMVGHRRWVLFPGLRRVGFGHAGIYNAMHVIDGSHELPKFDFFAFPAEGYYPLDLIEAHYAWSLHLNAGLVQAPGGEVKVAVSQLDEHFRSSRELTTKVVATVPDGITGVHVVIFKPEFGTDGLAAGRYRVQVTGLKTINRGPSPLDYVVDLVSMPAPTVAAPNENAPNDPAGAKPLPAGPAGRPGMPKQ